MVNVCGGRSGAYGGGTGRRDGEIANDTLKNDFRSIRPEEARILLLDGGPRVLTPFDPELSAKAEQALIRLGVRSLLNVKVVGVDKYGVRVHGPQGEKYIETRTVLWAAGVAAAGFTKVLAERTRAELDRGGRVIVDEFCNIPGHPEIYVIGDCALFKDKNGKPLPGVAPTAMQQGAYAASTIRKRLRGETAPPFQYFDKGSLAVVGRASAVAQFGSNLKFSGSVRAVMAFRPPDVPGVIPEPRDCVHSVGFQLHHVQSRRAPDHRRAAARGRRRGSRGLQSCRSS